MKYDIINYLFRNKLNKFIKNKFIINSVLYEINSAPEDGL
jgi:hypothetical protein